MQLGNPDRAPKGEAAALLLDGQRRRTGPPAAAGAADQLAGTASSPGAAGLQAVRIRYQGETWPWAAPRWRGTAGDVQGVPGHHLQLLIPVAYQVLQNGGPLPARRCPADPFPFGAWPVPADVVTMAIPCCGRRRRAADRYRELTRGHGAAPRWRGTAGDVQGVPGHHLQRLIPGTRPRSAPGAAGQSGSGTKGGSCRTAARWPTPANWMPCCCRRRRSAGGYRELTRCCRPCRQSGSGTRERRGHGQRLDGAGRPAASRADLAIPCCC